LFRKLIRWLFRDKLRVIAPVLSALLLAATMALWVSERTTTEVGYWACLEEPIAADGRDIVMSLFRVHAIKSDTHFVIEHGFREVPMIGDSTALSVGQIVSMGGVFRAHDKVVVESWRQHHHLRSTKVRYGILGVGLLFLLIPGWFRWGSAGLEERNWRPHG
jgi:hypothetical protein